MHNQSKGGLYAKEGSICEQKGLYANSSMSERATRAGRENCISVSRVPETVINMLELFTFERVLAHDSSEWLEKKACNNTYNTNTTSLSHSRKALVKILN